MSSKVFFHKKCSAEFELSRLWKNPFRFSKNQRDRLNNAKRIFPKPSSKLQCIFREKIGWQRKPHCETFYRDLFIKESLLLHFSLFQCYSTKTITSKHTIMSTFGPQFGNFTSVPTIQKSLSFKKSIIFLKVVWTVYCESNVLIMYERSMVAIKKSRRNNNVTAHFQ